MNTRFVETFVLLARIGSVRRVAERLHTTPGAISMRVRALENDLGIALFSWDRKTLQLTADGTRVLRHAESLMDATRLLRRIAKAGDESDGRVRVGVIESVVHTFLPKFMRSIAVALPKVEVDLTVDLTVNLGERLMQGELDLVLRVGADEAPAHSIVESLMALPVHWVSRRGIVPVRNPLPQVLHLQLLTLMRGSAPHRAAVNVVRELATQHGIASSELRISGSPSLAALVSLVREGVGVALMPGLFVKDEIEAGTLVRLDLPSPPSYRVATWYQRDAPPVVGEVAEVVRSVCRTYCRRMGADWVEFVG